MITAIHFNLMTKFYLITADAILMLHSFVVIFIVLGLLTIILGGILEWEWVRSRWFRILHLVAIALVIVQAWLGRICPLTLLEMWLRQQAGKLSYEVSFVQYWLQRLLYYDFPLWVFAIAYTLFGLAAVVSWFWVLPNQKVSHRS